MKKLESDKHSDPHFSCAANKLNHFLKKFIEMDKLMVIKDLEEPDSLNNHVSLLIINNKFFSKAIWIREGYFHKK